MNLLFYKSDVSFNELKVNLESILPLQSFIQNESPLQNQ
jgi:hypothetical protein